MNDEQTRERRVIGILAAGDAAAIDRYFLSLDDIPEWRFLRPPETGLVMMRGRIGGDGGPFNVGEVTVTRAAVSLADGPTGFAYALGRDRKKAEQSAVMHALWRLPARRGEIERDILAPLEATAAERHATTRREVEPTKVNFFTVVRGDD
ncbi:MAG: phosphonate C-P lyase system protein PhnG [Rhizobiaceae bacterium]